MTANGGVEWQYRPGLGPRRSASSARLSGALLAVKVTGLAQKLGQLEAVHRDFQSKNWANLKLLGQPCNFYALAVGREVIHALPYTVP
jgi:hypothetical protein